MRTKILFILHIPPPIHGSSMVGQYIKDSIKINNEFNCQYINLLASKNISDSGKVTISKLLTFTNIWFKLFGKLIVSHPNLCYFALTTTGAAFYRDLTLIALLRLFRIKIVFHLHNKGIVKASNSKIKRHLYKFVFKNADVILLSEHLYFDIKNYVPKINVHICPNGISDNYGSPKVMNRNLNKVTQILFLSNLIESKGVYILLESMALLKRMNTMFEGIFVGGEGDITADLFQQKVKDLNLHQHVKYLGKKYGIEKESIFANTDILVLPTYYPNECLPLVLLEAMQYSLPVVSTLEGGIRDIVEEGVTGFLVQQKNVEIVTEKLKVLIENPTLRLEMGQAGRKKYEHEFTIEIFENKLIEILKKVLNNQHI